MTNYEEARMHADAIGRGTRDDEEPEPQIRALRDNPVMVVVIEGSIKGTRLA